MNIIMLDVYNITYADIGILICFCIPGCRKGSTAIIQCQQPTTDICSFFTHMAVLCAGELVYFGGTGVQAVQLLGNAGMPCPPLYSPLEQFMHLIDPTFEVSCFLGG